MTPYLRGILCMLGAVAAFSFMDAGLKALSAHYGAMQVAALRGLASWPLIVLWSVANGGVGQLVRVRWPLHLLRGALSVAMLSSFAYALRYLPMTEAYSLFFVAPLMITALAGPMLGERVGWRRWVAIGVGLGGTLVILRPSGEGMLSLGGAAVLVSAASYSISAITGRILGRTDSTPAMMFWMITLLCVFATASALPDWKPVLAQDVWLLVGVGLSGTLGLYGITEAFRLTPASVAAPLEYTALAWGLLFDWLFWSTLPEARMVTGAAIIVIAGLYLLKGDRGHEG
ncbi:DMT family transporter [Tahibacter amnicola]|uniref:DMT family transporter n=1 Tax=Tahibacter amnicola TaxID=2976241 RepID=A0ABY6BNR3_9GAMM|nr:DMT family transporter [Tahibacter amnicola]UXI70030.1 DMT family transporter [Tahibacter amnicola]